MNAPDYIGNAISFYSIRKSDSIPGIPDEKETYDKMTVVMICLNPEFDIPMENDMGEELNQMCNLSDYVEELGIEKGIEKHLSQQVIKLDGSTGFQRPGFSQRCIG